MTDLMSFKKEMTISSREIAELTGKQHKNVLVDCDKLNEAYRNMSLAVISADLFTDNMNRQQRQYQLTKIQTFDLMTGYSIELRIKVNRRWEELENATPKVWTLEESLRHQLKLIEQNKILSAKIQENASKVIFADAVAGSSNSILVREFAKALSDDGFKIGQNRLFSWMRVKGYLNGKNEPYQNYIEQGLFEVIERIVGASNQTFTTRTTKITGKGQTYFAEKIRSGMGQGRFL